MDLERAVLKCKNFGIQIVRWIIAIPFILFIFLLFGDLFFTDPRKLEQYDESESKRAKKN